MIISGKELAGEIRRRISGDVKRYLRGYGRVPHLAIVLVGNDPASQTYVRGKVKDAKSVGFKVTLYEMEESTSEYGLLQLVARLNNDHGVDGILVQLPLPEHIGEYKVISSILPEKDVDGFHPVNVAALWQNRNTLQPCTPKGIIRLLDKADVDIDGKKAVVVGRGNIVGLPVTKLLLDRNATVTVCHSATPDLASFTRDADIIVAAAGVPDLIGPDMVKDGVVIIDVGINRDPETGALCGDVDFAGCEPKAAAITPVPGGVGPLTKACLLENTLECYLNKMDKND